MMCRYIETYMYIHTHSKFAITGGEHERAPHLFARRKLVCPCVRLSGLNPMGMHAEHVVVTVYIMSPLHMLKTLPERAYT